MIHGIERFIPCSELCTLCQDIQPYTIKLSNTVHPIRQPTLMQCQCIAVNTITMDMHILGQRTLHGGNAATITVTKGGVNTLSRGR